ncbi:hypothetical protein A9179_10570 [Pseudomonas alcaligenes]|uniref:Strictosidine synthase conserved region domain-containing protein n=1 Tax=Aquipseudomonas alcaligenes TaxID=43263 RepID=A0ABR7S0T2_AQUAC|nr:hypothetical protein [Pseudomonas alcaligenes]
MLGLLGICLLLGAAIPAWRHLYPATAANGWTSSVYLDGIERASALLYDDNGGLYVSQEIQDSQGRILQLYANGQTRRVIEGLSKPDGMAGYRDGVVYSQEQGEHPVIWMNEQGSRELFTADSVEGLASDGRYLYAVEDLHGIGRLLRYDFESDSVTTLRSGLDEAESIANCPDGRFFYTEKTLGHIRQLIGNGSDPVVLDGLHEPGFLLCNKEGLWITEDATHMARVLLWQGADRLITVLSHLRSPQTIVEVAPGHYLLAEQGRNRILQLSRQESQP